MGAQERGELDDAERFAARALDLDPTGSVGAHPMAHVYFERGDHRAGVAWLEDWLATADDAAEFTTHLHWHAALHHLALGDTDEVLARYRDRLCRPEPRSMVDRTSMLWRLQMRGVVDPGVDPSAAGYPRPLRDSVDMIPVTFFAVHVALGLAALGDSDSLRRLAETADSAKTPGAAKFVSPIALALAERVEGDFGAAATRLLPLADELTLVGGSHAQREVFEDTLIDSLIRSGRHEEASTRLQERLDRRPSMFDQRWLAACDATVAQPRQRA
jgi:predicted Zn-dependent protease